MLILYENTQRIVHQHWSVNTPTINNIRNLIYIFH